MQRDDDIHHLTEADRTSETRFGPRRVPEGHKTASPYPHRPMRSSRIPPSGPVSPDGKTIWPRPSLTAKVIVWGGVAAATVAATAGAVIATRKLADLIHGDGHGRGGKNRAAHLAPRFADMNEDGREAIRARVRMQARKDQRRAASLRAEASRRRNVADDLTRTATGLSSGLNGVTNSLVQAFNGFRSVAGQASGIIAEFAIAADQLRAILRGSGDQDSDRGPSRNDNRPKDDERHHRL